MYLSPFRMSVFANKRLLVSRSAASVAFALLITSQCFAQTRESTPQSLSQLTASEKELVESSQKAIIATGLSPTYFSTHFKLLSVVNREADRRVVWEFAVNEHRAIVVDAIRYKTAGRQRVSTHSVANALGRTIEITRTLTRAAALKKMGSCIGSFEQPEVQYIAVDGVAQLVLTAAAQRVAEVSTSRRPDEAGAKKNATNQIKPNPGADVIEPKEQEKRPPLVLGIINLVTGKCAKRALP